MDNRYRLVSKPGVTVAVVNGGKLLLLKRIRLPFIVNPGIWYLVGGGRKGSETPLQNAYREVREELGIGKEELEVLSSSSIVVMDRTRKQRWKNPLFIMHSRHRKVKLNIENRDYRWVGISALRRYSDLLGAFEDPEGLVKMIKGCLNRRA